MWRATSLLGYPWTRSHRLETRVVSQRVSRSRFSFSFYESLVVTKIGISQTIDKLRFMEWDL
jgi:hypothetical protein